MMLLIDMNLSPRWMVFLAAHGIEAHHCRGLVILKQLTSILWAMPNRMTWSF